MRKSIVVNYARRLYAKYNLVIPVDLLSLAYRYAQVKFINIPFDIDGISVDLKVRGKIPKILVNQEKPINRQRFTLAHEIGHVVIPWHTGTIFDKTDNNYTSNSVTYWEIEAEANAFATEFLMPEKWIFELIQKNRDIAIINRLIANEAKVSPIAACLRLRSILPPGYLFIVQNNSGEIVYTGKSDGTFADAISIQHSDSIEEYYSFAESIYKYETNWEIFFWIKFPSELKIPIVNHDEDWRKMLDSILSDVKCSTQQKIKYKQRINGIIGFANSAIKKVEYTKESLFSACFQKFKSKTDLEIITKHKLFESFLSARIQEVINKAHQAHSRS